jgi:hypothetical protein
VSRVTAGVCPPPAGSSSAYDVAVDTAYNPAELGTFAVGLTTANGALTWLVFVAVSIRVR